MKLLCIAVLSIILFFVSYVALHPLFGENAALLCLFMMYIGFPALFLKFWKKEWEGPVVKFGNYMIALVVLGFSIWYSYLAIIGEAEKLNAVMFFLVYGYGALHFLTFGKLHFQIKRSNEI
ncbi:hypothetical protein EDC56_3533 [Sinobacterium caligoides]|uniref:Uncharacterized protein n=1 Tax=Sinobacterium caligoides TaxID=933926 RepID=A0A3N2DDM0_9GAMM|nr:hypothetical protein [Sinobacterium caligoides]ROR97866.1 hypothetical protein EDC56_3533 [Sinobacterium caligoides]